MTLEEMKAEYEAARLDHKACQTNTAKLGIGNALYELKKKIDLEQNRVDSKLKTVMISGKEQIIPYSFYGYEKKTLKADDNDVLYLLNDYESGNYDSSYHCYHYAWIPQSQNKYAKLLVRTLGGDRFGDRYYLEVNYYKHPADQFPYLSKCIAYNNRTYKPYADFILNELGLTERLKNYKG